MSEYICHRCGYTASQRINLRHHLNRKKICKPILGDNSIEEIKKHYNFEINEIPQNTTLLPQNTTLLPQNTTLLPQNTTKENQCKYCNKILSRYDSLNRHLKICKKKKESERLVIKQEEEIQQMKLEIEELKTKSATTNNITNTINTNNNTNNIINIKNLGDENINHLKNVDFAGMLKGIYNAVPKLIEKIHFDPNHPENQNIKYTNKKLPYLKVMKDNKWQLVNKKYELFDLIDNKCYLLKEKYYKILEKNKYNINEFQKNKIEEFMDKYNEDDKRVMLDLIEKTELMLLNNSQ
jgi:hypothetical protein